VTRSKPIKPARGCSSSTCRENPWPQRNEGPPEQPFQFLIEVRLDLQPPRPPFGSRVRTPRRDVITSALPAWAFWTLQVLLWIAQIPEREGSRRHLGHRSRPASPPSRSAPYRLKDFTNRKKQANAFDLRYAADVAADEEKWELCERVLARHDVVERLSRGWTERQKLGPASM
jgi:hypothetical protein